MNCKYLGIVILILITQNSYSQLKLPGCFTDNMVLQRDQPVKIWGKASPGGKVRVKFAQKVYASDVTADGMWTVVLPPMAAGGPYTAEFISKNETFVIKDIYLGDVWFCSGQSNMAFKMKQVQDHEKELSDTDYPLIRQFEVDRAGAEKPLNDVGKGRWIV